MSKASEMIGRRFGCLVVVSESNDKQGVWLCHCDCGNSKEIIGTNLRSKRGAAVGTISCGHLAGRTPITMVGRIFGHLTVLEFAGTKNKKGVYDWVCRCDCGVVKTIDGSALRKGSTISCGHVKAEITAATRFCKKLPPGESAKRKALRAMRDSARQRSIVLKLNDQELLQLSQQDCNYCGSAPSNCSKTETGLFFWNGLDRVNSKGIYSLENVVPCCRHCNYSKGTRTREDFITWVKRINERH